MNAVSQALRIIAIVAALAAAGLYVLSEKKVDQMKNQVRTTTDQLTTAKQSAADAQKQVAADDAAKADLQKQLDTANSNVDAYKTMLTQAKTDADNAKHAAEDKDNQLSDLNKQVATLNTQVASIDSLKQQIAALEAEKAQAPTTTTTGANNSGTPSANPSSPDQGGPASTGPSTSQTFSTTATPTTILDMNARQGVIVIAAGTSSGLANDAQFVLQKSGVKVAQIQVTDAEPDYSVAMILTGSTVKQLAKGQTVDYIRVR